MENKIDRVQRSKFPRLSVKPDELAMEQYRVLRAKIHNIASARDLKTIMITSTVPGEGKTTTAVNLAMVFSNFLDQKTIIVDCDLRRSRLHAVFDLPRAPGLTDVLLGQVPIESALREAIVGRLWVLTAGRPIENSTEVIGSGAMAPLLRTLKERFKTVVLDASPVLPLADPLVLSRLVDGIIFVIQAGKTPKKIVLMALQDLPTQGLLGTVMNQFEIGRSIDHRYVYHQYHSPTKV